MLVLFSMDRRDEPPTSEDRDHDRIPDDADVAEAVKDVADTFKGRGQTPGPSSQDRESAIPASDPKRIIGR